jgi:hypothetical protein
MEGSFVNYSGSVCAATRLRLVRRHHVDLLRTASATCRA